MFNENEVKAFNSVKSPEELHDLILSSAEKSKSEKPLFKSGFSKTVAVAACIVFVVAAVFASFNKGGEVTVRLYENTVNEGESVAITQEIAPYALAREFSPASIEFELEFTKEALITVDSGSFDIVDEESNLTEFTADKSVKIVWHSDGMNKSTMTIDYGRNTCELVLEYKNEWVITRK